MNPEKINWGVLGAGRIARTKWLPGILKSEHATIRALASSHAGEMGRQVQESFRIEKLYGTYEELLADGSIQAVYIALPNHLHYEWCMRAAEHGKHVLCEKPLTLTSHQSEELFAAFNARSLQLVEAFMYRFDPRIQRVKGLLDEGVIGSLRRVKSSFTFFLTDPKNIRLKKESGGGALFDIGSYTINACRYFMGEEPVAVRAELRSRQGGEVEDEAEFVLYFSNDRLGVMDISFNTPWQEMVMIEGEKGRIEVPGPYTVRGIQPSIVTIRQDFERNEPRFTTESLGTYDDYTLETETFSRSLLGLPNDLPRIIPSGDATANLRVIEAIRESSATGRKVAVNH
jgi:predicted dehydrogenase